MSMEVLLSEVASFDRGFAAQHKPQSLRMLNATPCDLGDSLHRDALPEKAIAACCWDRGGELPIEI